MGKKSKKKAIVIAAMVIALAAAAAFGTYKLFFQEEERVPITGKTSFGALNEAIEGSGTTKPADSVSYTVSGKVLEWHVKAGQEVHVGDLLYVLDSSDKRDEILEAEVELSDLYQQRSDLRDNVTNQGVTAEFNGRIQDIKTEVGKRVQSGAQLATLVDDSVMKTTLYFSYVYEQDIAKGMAVTVSIPDQMMTLDGTVTDVQYVDYITPEGMRCFAVTVELNNPGSLTKGTKVTCWIEKEGSYIYAVDSAQLEFRNEASVTSGASGEVSGVNVVNYQRVTAGQSLFTVDASDYETQLERVQKQIDSYEEKIADLQESINTEYSRYADIEGKVVRANYSTNRMTGQDSGTVTIYNQESMQISVNIDELDADYLEEGMEVYVYRTTSSGRIEYPATLTYLSLEATSGSSGVSTFEATITIDSKGELSSGVTAYYSIDTTGGGGTKETVLAPLNAVCTYDSGHYMIVQSEKKPDNAIEPSEVGGTVTDFPKGYYAVPVEAGDYNGNLIQILSGVEKDAVVFLRYMNVRPSGGNTTSNVRGEEGGQMSGYPNMGGFGGNRQWGQNGSSGNRQWGQNGSSGNRTQGGNSGNRTQGGNSGNRTQGGNSGNRAG